MLGIPIEKVNKITSLVPDVLQPVNQDGEVQRFERLTLSALEDWLVQGRFTPEASLVLASYMGW